MALSDKARKTLEKVIDEGSNGSTPGIIAHIRDKSGKTLFSYHAGLRGLDTKKPLENDTLIWYASATKIHTATAAMQLVERGKLALDDENVVEKLCPELSKLKVLTSIDGEGQPVYEEKRQKITVRMLMSHTSGLGYVSFNPLLRKALPEGFIENNGTVEALCTPLLFQPGTDFGYGIGYDWLGIVIERVTGENLNDYLQKNVFEPLGMQDMTMYPRGSQIERLATLHYRHPEAGIVPINPDPWRGYGFYDTKPQCGGGTNLQGPPEQFLKLPTALLNGGKDPLSGAQVLAPESVDVLLGSRVAQFSRSRRGAKDVNPFILNECDEFSMPGYEGKTKAWALGGAVEESEGIVWWGGATNQYWWIDCKRGITGIVGTSMLPFFDPVVMGVWKQILDVVNSGV